MSVRANYDARHHLVRNTVRFCNAPITSLSIRGLVRLADAAVSTPQADTAHGPSREAFRPKAEGPHGVSWQLHVSAQACSIGIGDRVSGSADPQPQEMHADVGAKLLSA
jgi:hypothetical protein